jgi:hypothetical protein
MTSSQSWSSAHPNGSSSSAELEAPMAGRSSGPIRVALSRDQSLAKGMSVTAAIEARLLGIRLLHLRAAIDVLPAQAKADGAPANRTRPSSARHRAPAGRALADASRAIDAGAADLRSARELSP